MLKEDNFVITSAMRHDVWEDRRKVKLVERGNKQSVGLVCLGFHRLDDNTLIPGDSFLT